MFKPPLEIPGNPNRPPDKPGSRICSKCKRVYSALKPKKEGKVETLHCPFCGHLVDRRQTDNKKDKKK